MRIHFSPVRGARLAPGDFAVVLIVYNIVLTLLYPVFFAYFATAGKKDDKFSGTMSERYARYPGLPPKKPGARRVWLHAVSVGEAVAAAPLIKSFRQAHPSHELIISTTTKAGKQLLHKTFGDDYPVIFFPFDFPWVAARAVRSVAPDLLVLMETELWPNVIYRCSVRGAPVLLLNGRVSDRMAAASGAARMIYSWAFSKISAMGMQTETDARRLADLGAPAEKTSVPGNLKFDALIGGQDIARAAELDKIINPKKRKSLAAGSTHPGEEELVLDAFAEARKSCPELLLVLAPRHIERSAQVAELARSRGFKTSLRSAMENDPDAGAADVVTLDTIGELRVLYAVSTLAYVGGSLIERGGHNVLEPAACGKAPIYGPHTANFRDSVRALEEAGGGRPVADAPELAKMLAELLADDAERLRGDALAFRAMRDNAGAVEKSLKIIEKFL